MNHRTRVRLLQSGVALVLLLFIAVLVRMMLQGQRDAAPEQPSATEQFAAEALQAEAEQISTGFEVTRTREGAPEITVRAERLLGLRGDVYLLQEPTLEIHHEGQEPSIVQGRNGTFDMKRGVGTVNGEAHAVLRDKMIVDSQRLDYRDGGPVDATGNVRFRRGALEGESEELHYDPAGEVVVLQGEVRVRGLRQAPDGQGHESWTLETGWLRYFSQQGRVQTQSFVLMSDEGTLSGDRLELELGEAEGDLRHLVSIGDAILRVPAKDGEGPVSMRVMTGDRIEIEPPDDDAAEPRRILSRGNAHLSQGGGSAQDLWAEVIDWQRGSAVDDRSARDGEVSRIDARGDVILDFQTEEGASHLTTSRLKAWLDVNGVVQRGTAYEPVRYEGPEGSARCHEADFEDGGDRLVLRSESGPPAVMEIPEGRIVARRLDLSRSRGELTATIEVQTLHTGPASEGLFQAGEPVHGTADKVVALRREGRIHYEGAARLWQGENLLQADTIEILQDSGVLEAEGQVSTRSVVPEEDGSGQRMVLGTAEHFLYRDDDKTAVYSCKARLRWGSEEVEAEQIHVSLGEDRKVSRVQAEGDVRLRSPGSYATGHRLDYDVAGGEAILHGGDRLAIAQNLENQQVVKGHSLTMDLSGGTINMQSGPGGRTWITLSPSASAPDSAEGSGGSRKGEAKGGSVP